MNYFPRLHVRSWSFEDCIDNKSVVKSCRNLIKSNYFFDWKFQAEIFFLEHEVYTFINYELFSNNLTKHKVFFHPAYYYRLMVLISLCLELTRDTIVSHDDIFVFECIWLLEDHSIFTLRSNRNS